MKNTEDVMEIDIQELLWVLIHWIWLIAICGLFGGMGTFVFSSFLLTPQYESTTKVYILDTDTNSGSLTYTDMQLGALLTKDYVQLIKDRTVLEKVLETLGMEESYGSLQSRIKVEAQADTRIIAIIVTDKDPQNAQILADEIRKVAAEHIKDVTEIQAVNVVEEANLPVSPSGPNVFKWTVIGMSVGVFGCALAICLWFLLDDTVKTTDDVERYLEISTLSMIPVIGDVHAKKGKRFSIKFGRAAERESRLRYKRDINYSDSDEIRNPKPNLDETGDLEEVL